MDTQKSSQVFGPYTFCTNNQQIVIIPTTNLGNDSQSKVETMVLARRKARGSQENKRYSKNKKFS